MGNLCSGATMTVKVAMIEPVGGHGGMDYYDFGLCDGLGKAGADVVLYTCDETTRPQSQEFICCYSFKKIFGESPTWLRGIRYIFGIIKTLTNALVEKRKICHLHFFNVGWLQLFSISLSRLFMRRVVVTAHDVEPFHESLDIPLMSRWGYRLAHRVIVHNEISRQELIRRMCVNPAKVDVIAHGNYLNVISVLPPKDKARKHLGIPLNANVLLFFGQIKEVKGLDILIRAMPAIIKQYPNTILLIAGKTWRIDFQYYQNLIDELNIGLHCVSHIRYINNDEVPIYYAASDMVILPYQRIYQSGVVLMSMSYAKPVLVSDIPGMLEVVTNDKTGFVFHKGDADDLANQVCRIFALPSLLDSVAAQSLALMKQEYDWSLIGKKTLDSYRAIYK